MSKAKTAVVSVFCLIAIAGCSGGGSTSGSNGHGDSPASWFHKGYHFARESIAKGEPSDNAAAFVKAGQDNQLSWCNDAYAPIFQPHAPARKQYEGVTTNAPPRGKPTSKASAQAYQEWLAGCVAGLAAKS